MYDYIWSYMRSSVLIGGRSHIITSGNVQPLTRKRSSLILACPFHLSSWSGYNKSNIPRLRTMSSWCYIPHNIQQGVWPLHKYLLNGRIWEIPDLLLPETAVCFFYCLCLWDKHAQIPFCFFHLWIMTSIHVFFDKWGTGVSYVKKISSQAQPLEEGSG